ncbi:FKBP-type peptidyl-prolyl cis-trans isomerase [Agromyces larvae]|uniref:Peptidyl-prolyl cis-trans isomerase n=1 Tax=Agromyces larvae TaxID=2929802 RepID=A0ABY4C0Z3_9MICO|nr:FKBP-type peptidyl-prolyl cis-trans isomerase [Agromyces larvae]UOE45090.1 FKBP-type peptidyl-prolyl cis-trans isomerase [Agromyces larvae]
MRSSIALIAVAGTLAVALTGCAGPVTEAETSPGASSDAVSVRGDFGEVPTVSFPTPLAPERTQCTEVIEGEGDLLAEGQTVMLAASLFDGTTGDEIQTVGFAPDEPVMLTLGSPTTLPGFTTGLTCAREGSRVVVVVPPADAANPTTGAAPETSVVAVFDVQRAFPARADGAPALTRDGFPAVVLAPDGRPGITVPKSDPPAKTEVEVLLQGDGDVVESGDTVVVQYTGVLWDTGKVFDSTWEKGAVGRFTVADDDTSQVVPGFATGLIGQKVGSQVGIIIPPADGYGDQGSGQVPGGATIFFVVDILGVV